MMTPENFTSYTV